MRHHTQFCMQASCINYTYKCIGRKQFYYRCKLDLREDKAIVKITSKSFMLWSDNNRICLLRHYNNLFFFVQNYCNYLYVPFQIIKYCNYVNDFLYLFVQNSYKSILATSILHVIIILKLGNIRRKFCRLPKVFYAKSSVHIM